jgi:type IV pilus assembly protein PilX
MMDTLKISRHNGHCASPRRERGVVLMVALIALVALTLAGIALIRSIDTGNLIAGNMAFRQAAVQNSDIGVQAAFSALPNIVSVSKNTNIANQYFAIKTTVDSEGLPSGVTWSAVPCRDNLNAVVTCSSQDYQVKYVIERLCDYQTGTSTVITDFQGYCMVNVGSGATGSKGSFGAVFSSVDAVYYRTTVQVTGPRNTTAYVQAIFTTGN